jgi:hypothetical protein
METSLLKDIKRLKSSLSIGKVPLLPLLVIYEDIDRITINRHNTAVSLDHSILDFRVVEFLQDYPLTFVVVIDGYASFLLHVIKNIPSDQKQIQLICYINIISVFPRKALLHH